MDQVVSGAGAPDHEPMGLIEPGNPGIAIASQPKKKSTPKRSHNRHRQDLAAVIDLGTNNCRLLIAQRLANRGPGPRSSAFRVVDSFSRIVRLGEGLGQSGELSPEAIDRTVEALRVCAGKIAKSGAKEIRAVATQACRQATNGEAFLERVRAETGIRLKTITPMQEVQLGVSSTLPLLKRRWPYALIFDVGGGSTEVSFLKFREKRGFQLADSISVATGVVSLAEGRDNPDREICTQSYAKMQQGVSEAFLDFAERNNIPALQAEGVVQTVGMSGTVTTVKALDLGLQSYRRNLVDRTVFDMERLAAIRDSFLIGGTEALAENGCIGRDRSDLVLPGMAILEGLGDAFNLSKLLVLDRGLREGLLHDIFKAKRRRPKKSPPKQEPCKTAEAA